jgi:hypothetical protein
LGLVAGQWLDGQVHTGLLFTLIGVFAGLILGMSSVVAFYRATLRSSEREWREESGSPPSMADPQLDRPSRSARRSGGPPASG